MSPRLVARVAMMGVLVCAAWLPGGVLKAQEGERPVPAEVLRDPEFGVETRQGFALRREVQMLQWVPRTDGGGDRLEWRDAAVAGDGLAAGHQNPAALPVAAMLWRTDARMPDGRELAPAQLLASGEWRLLSPDAAALPPNLAATFQSSGEVLTTAADPDHPEAGDLRLRWSALVLPPHAAFVPGADGWAPARPDAGTGAASSGDSMQRSARWPYWLAAILLLALVAVLAARRRAS